MTNKIKYIKVYTAMKKGKKHNYESFYKLYELNKEFITSNKVLSLKFWRSMKVIGDFSEFILSQKITYIEKIFNNFFIHKASNDDLIKFYELYSENSKLFSNILLNLKTKIKENEIIDTIVEDFIYDDLIVGSAPLIDELKKDYNLAQIMISKKVFKSFINLKKNFPKKCIIEIKSPDDVLNILCLKYCICKDEDLTRYLKRARIFACIDFSTFTSSSVSVFTYMKNPLYYDQIDEVHDWKNSKYEKERIFNIYDNFKIEMSELKLIDDNINYPHVFLKNSISRNKDLALSIIKDKGIDKSMELLLIILFNINRKLFKKIISYNKYYCILLIDTIDENKTREEIINWYIQEFGVDGDVMAYFYKIEHIALFDNNQKIYSRQLEFHIGENSEDSFVEEILKRKLKYRIENGYKINKNHEIFSEFINDIIASNMKVFHPHNYIFFKKTSINYDILLELKKEKNNIPNDIVSLLEKKIEFGEYNKLINLDGNNDDYLEYVSKNPVYISFLHIIKNNKSSNIDEIIVLHDKIKKIYNLKDFIFFCNLFILNEMKTQKIAADLCFNVSQYFSEYYEANTIIKINKYKLEHQKNNEIIIKELSIYQIGYMLAFTDSKLEYRHLISQLHHNIKLNNEILSAFIFTFSLVYTKSDIISLFNKDFVNKRIYIAMLYTCLINGEKNLSKLIYYKFMVTFKEKVVLQEMEYWLNRYSIYL